MTCQSWLLTTQIDCDESVFSQKMWTALGRTRYLQSSKTFVMVDRPFWKDKDPATGRDVMSMTLTDRLTRGTYLFDHGDDRPGVICLTYSWMSDALKMLPYPVDQRVRLALGALKKIYPDLDIAQHIIGNPITVSREADEHFLGAFKGALPGHYRYNQRMYAHFVQDDLPSEHRGIFLAGDDVCWTPAWVEGAVQTSLNAVWGILRHFGGSTSAQNPGPGDSFADLGPIALPDQGAGHAERRAVAGVAQGSPAVNLSPLRGVVESAAVRWVGRALDRRVLGIRRVPTSPAETKE